MIQIQIKPSKRIIFYNIYQFILIVMITHCQDEWIQYYYASILIQMVVYQYSIEKNKKCLI